MSELTGNGQNVTVALADVLGWIVVTALGLLTVLFFWLDYRATGKRPDLYGHGGKFGRRSSSIWMLFVFIFGFATYLLYRLIWHG